MADLGTRLGRRVAEAADAAVARRGAVSVLDTLTALGWVTDRAVDTWRQGRVDALQDLIQAPPDKQRAVVVLLTAWAEARGMERHEGEYPAATRDRRELRFTSRADSADERGFRAHWVSPNATAAQRGREERRRAKVPDLEVQEADGPWECAGCGLTAEGPKLVEDGAPRCLTCVDLDHLEFLPAGDATLTRRARKESVLSAVVVRWVPSRKRFRRLGLLVEERALVAAEEACLADEDARARRRERDAVRRADQDVVFQERFAAEITRLFPGCPADRARSIAEHTGVRGSGRVGRSAAGRDLAPGAVRRAVVASVRHEDTPYDRLLMDGVPREEARARIADGIDRVLAGWA
ncbi:DUF2293 domain-containing protein [Nocardiopsis sp. EMB25]|uniref:DUF2293 domain-containing protein n=1 Tax=Nocardiopsis sp. EMB25 TaxID=2835867 RepID=UPI002284D14F|nr:DUF2293 domain-containing protein [Nocardiopsis sp. EMB25]MCY9784078.1 DUF2293 domain-containing protein [Nocardiopsis sp. EMB25]